MHFSSPSSLFFSFFPFLPVNVSTCRQCPAPPASTPIKTAALVAKGVPRGTTALAAVAHRHRAAMDKRILHPSTARKVPVLKHPRRTGTTRRIPRDKTTTTTEPSRTYVTAKQDVIKATIAPTASKVRAPPAHSRQIATRLVAHLVLPE